MDSATLTVEEAYTKNKLSNFSSWAHQPFPLDHIWIR